MEFNNRIKNTKLHKQQLLNFSKLKNQSYPFVSTNLYIIQNCLSFKNTLTTKLSTLQPISTKYVRYVKKTKIPTQQNCKNTKPMKNWTKLNYLNYNQRLSNLASSVDLMLSKSSNIKIPSYLRVGRDRMAGTGDDLFTNVTSKVLLHERLLGKSFSPKTVLTSSAYLLHRPQHNKLKTKNKLNPLTPSLKTQYNSKLKVLRVSTFQYKPYLVNNEATGKHKLITFTVKESPKYNIFSYSLPGLQKFIKPKLGLNLNVLAVATNQSTQTSKKFKTSLRMCTRWGVIRARQTHNLTLGSIGVFIVNNLRTYLNIKGSLYKYLYKNKKSLYTFTKPNQIKNTILRRKSLLIFYKTIFHTRNNLNNRLKLRSVFTKRSVQLFYENYANQYPTITHTKNILNIPNENSAQNFKEVRLSRVRFKPGYQRMWRDARYALKEVLNLRFIYQKQLTKYIIRFYKKSTNVNFYAEDLTLSKLVIYSRLSPDTSTFNLFFSNKLFFVNGILPSTKNFKCVVNDFIQLVVSKWYYIFFRWIIHWTTIRSNKLRKLIYRKGLSSRYRVMKSRKQKSYTVPDWIFSTKYDFSDVKPFLEVDYFTLSVFIIYEPYTTYYYAPTNLLLPKTQIYRLYNWKYIT